MPVVHYTETRERSAEILRAVLAQMAQHDACLNPVTFAVWYEHLAGINPHLSAALQACLADEPRLGDAAVARLHAAHVAEPGHEQMQQVSTTLQSLMQELAARAGRTGEQAGVYGDELGLLARALRLPADAPLAPMVEQAAASTRDMRDAATRMAQEMAAHREEVERLRGDLARARREAQLDPITQVMNRRGFDERLAALAGTAPADGARHALVMVDIDHFKAVNDTHGHLMGDRVLQGLASVLRAAVPQPELNVARFGGEEFAVLLPDASREDALRLAGDLLQRTRAMSMRDRRTGQVVQRVTISAGVAWLVAGEDAGAWLARADAAMYRSKQDGRDRVTAL